MGLMDVLNGMVNGPRGEQEPGKGDMSPITMAIMALLAYKAVKKFGADNASAAPPTQTAGANMAPQSMPGTGGGQGGGLGGMLGGGLGGLGGLLAGAGAGGMLSGGLNDLLNQFRNSGQGDAAESWVGNGQNKPIAPSALEGVLGGERIEALLRQTGMSKDELLQGLSKYLPDAVNHLTPNGRVPNEQEMGRHI